MACIENKAEIFDAALKKYLQDMRKILWIR